MQSLLSKILPLVALVAISAPAQDAGRVQDLFTAAESNKSLSLFTSSLRMTGMAKTIRSDGPMTVFALTDRAFANLPKDALQTLLANPVAMHFLLVHYIAPGTIAGDAESLTAARTIAGVKLRVDIRPEGTYVNGARLTAPAIPCTNGLIYVLDSFDPGLVHDALALAATTRRAE